MGEYMAARRAGYKDAAAHNDAINAYNERTFLEKAMAAASGAAKAFVAFQSEVENVLKDSKNPHYGSTYASLAAILDTIRPILAKHKLAVMQHARMEGSEAVLATTLVHESGETLDGGCYPLRPVKQDPQGYGSAMTYARRYTLAALCGIAQEDDDGNLASAKPAPRPAPAQRPAPAPRDAVTRKAPDAADMEKRINNTPIGGSGKATRYGFNDRPKGAVLAGRENKQKYWCEIHEMSNGELIEAHLTLNNQASYEMENGKETKWTDKDMAAVETEMRARKIEIPTYD